VTKLTVVDTCFAKVLINSQVLLLQEGLHFWFLEDGNFTLKGEPTSEER
jgi:hypothetical protein